MKGNHTKEERMTEPKDTDKTVIGLSAIATVQKLSGGKFLADVESALLRVAEEVVRTGKAGAVTVKFKVTKPQEGEPLVTVQENISVALPSPAGSGAFYFVHDGRFYATDPRQPEMDFRIVEQPDATPRTGIREEHVREA